MTTELGSESHKAFAFNELIQRTIQMTLIQFALLNDDTHYSTTTFTMVMQYKIKIDGIYSMLWSNSTLTSTTRIQYIYYCTVQYILQKYYA